MAIPRGSKRTSITRKAGSPKKARTDANHRKLEAVTEALRISATDLPDHVRDILADSAQHALLELAVNRSSMQAAIVDKVGLTLDAVSERLQAAVAEHQAPVDASASEFERLRGNVSVAEAEVMKAQEAHDAARLATVAAEAAAKTGAQKFDQCCREQDREDKAYAQLEKKKGDLQHALTDVFGPLKGKVADNHDLKALTHVAKGHHFEEALIASMATGFGAEPAARGTFEELIFTQFEEALNGVIAGVDAQLAAGADAKAERKAVKLGLFALRDVAREKASECVAVEMGCFHAEKVAKAGLVEAKQAVSSFTQDQSAQLRALEAAKQEYTVFRDSIMVAFSDLKSLAPPEPEAPAGEAAEETAAAEPAA